MGGPTSLGRTEGQTTEVSVFRVRRGAFRSLNRVWRQSDAYHTCYCLSGLSSAQHRVIVSEGRGRAIISLWESGGGCTGPLNSGSLVIGSDQGV